MSGGEIERHVEREREGVFFFYRLLGSHLYIVCKYVYVKGYDHNPFASTNKGIGRLKKNIRERERERKRGGECTKGLITGLR